MNKIINWIFGSFFRTLGRIFVYILLGLVLSYLLKDVRIPKINVSNLIMYMSVSADTKKLPDNDTVYELTINNTTYDGKDYQNSNIDKNTSTTLNLGLVARSGSFVSFPFFALDICATDNIIVNRTYSSGQACTNSCFSNQVSTIKTSFTCSTSNTPGNIYRVKIPVAKFTIGASGTSLNTIDDSITISTKSNYVVASNIMSAYLTDEFNEQIDYSSTIDNSTNTIIDNQNQNNQQVIDNQNQNSQQIIDSQNNLLGSTCQNLVDLSSFTSRTINGITFTNNNDGSITINGTATANFGITFSNFVIDSGTYTANSSSFNYYLYDYNSLTSILNQGETKSFSSTYNNLGIDSYINSGQTFNNVLFKPMITKSSSSLPYCKYGSINSKLDDVSSSINDKSQEIINNQNSNTDKEIQSQKVCQSIDKKNIIENGALVSNSGLSFSTNDARGVTDYIKIDNDTIIKNVSSNGTILLNNLCFYNINKSFISCLDYTSYDNNQNIPIPNNASYVRFTINSSTNRPTFEVCRNGNQAMNDYITDDTAPNSDISSLGTVQGLLPPGPVDSLLNIPVVFLSVITSSMSGTCSPLQGQFVFGSTLSIPCFGDMIYDNDSFPPVLMLFINAIPSAFILIKYFKHLYKKVDRAVSMDATADDDWGVI